MSKEHEYTDYINTTAVSQRIRRFDTLNEEQQTELVGIITKAKTAQLQALYEIKISPLFEYSGIEPDVLAKLVPIILDVSEESKNLVNWEPHIRNSHPDEQLYAALEQEGGKEYVDEYYSFCSNIRHEYLLNKPTQTYINSFSFPMAEKLLASDRTEITKYITGNPLALDKTQYALIQAVYPIESLSNSFASREAANADFTLSGNEIKQAVTAFFHNAVQKSQAPEQPSTDSAPKQSFSDPMSGDLTREQHAEKVKVVQDAQNRQLLVRAVKNSDLTAIANLLNEKHIDPTTAKQNGKNVLSMALSSFDPEMFNMLWVACPTEKRLTFLSEDDAYGINPLRKAFPAQITTMLAGIKPQDRAMVLSQKGKYGKTPLHEALPEQITAMFAGIESKDRATVLSQQDNEGRTPLHGAPLEQVTTMLAGMESKDRATVLLRQDNGGRTPLHAASPEQTTAMLEGMESKDRATVLSQQDNDGQTLLHHYSVNAKKITAMLEGMESADKITLLSQQNREGRTPLHWASAEQITAMLAEMKSQDKLTALSQQNRKGPPPLYRASAERITAMLEGMESADKITLLIQQDAQGRPPLYDASAEQITAMLGGMESKDRLTLLMQKNREGNTPLHRASAEQITAILAGMEPQDKLTLLSQKNDRDQTPLHGVDSYGHPHLQVSADSITAMLEGIKLADKIILLSQRDAQGSTPLHRANAEGTTAMLAGVPSADKVTLLTQGENYAITPLYGASLGKTTAILEGMESNDKIMVLSQQDNEGKTLLHIAAERNESEDARLLLANGADPTIRCNESSDKFINRIHGKGATAADLARRRGYPELADELQAAKNTYQNRSNSWVVRSSAPATTNIHER